MYQLSPRARPSGHGSGAYPAGCRPPSRRSKWIPSRLVADTAPDTDWLRRRDRRGTYARCKSAPVSPSTTAEPEKQPSLSSGPSGAGLPANAPSAPDPYCARAPVHRSPLGGVRVMLIKAWYQPSNHTRPFGSLIHRRGPPVIVRIPAQIQRLALCLEYLFSPGDCVSHHFHSFDSDSGRLRHQRIGGGFAGAQQEDGNKGGAEHQHAHDQVGLGEAIFS